MLSDSSHSNRIESHNLPFFSSLSLKRLRLSVSDYQESRVMCPTSFVHADPGFFIRSHLTNKRAVMAYTCRSCSEHDLDVWLYSSECAELHPPPRQPGGYYHRKMTAQLNMRISTHLAWCFDFSGS